MRCAYSIKYIIGCLFWIRWRLFSNWYNVVWVIILGTTEHYNYCSTQVHESSLLESLALQSGYFTRMTNSTLSVMCSLPAACAIVLYTKQGLALFESVPASQAATSPLCLASHSDVGEQKGSSPSTMSFDLCHPVRRTQVCLRPSSERWANPSVTPAKERGKENRVLEVGTVRQGLEIWYLNIFVRQDWAL